MPSALTDLTEADFEAGISKVLQQLFPTLTAANIRHQLSFRVRLGRTMHDIEGNFNDWARGRCDILIIKDERPLAILELKRPGVALSDDDRIQGISYARLMEPWPPLVIVSNTEETGIYETFSGKEWKPTNRDELALSSLLKSSATLATTDLSHAVETLLGSNEKCWTSVVRLFTADQIDRLTGSWDDLLAPFPKDLLLPRKATAFLRLCLEKTDQIPFVVGPPLSGKSNVLREFIRSTEEAQDFVVLYLDADSSGQGIFQTIANLMTRSLGWGFDANQARTWLHRLSRLENSPVLVVMLDGGGAPSLKAELDELALGTYGPNLRLVVSIDEGMADRLLRSPAGRQRTAVGTKAGIIRVKPLDDDEFALAEQVLYALRFAFMHGSQRAADHRVPWLLRSLVGMFSNDPEYADVSLAAAIPSVPGMQPLVFAEQRFGCDATRKGQYLKIAEAILSDVVTVRGSLNISLLRVTSYVCRFDTLKRFLGDTELNELVSQGYLKHHIIDNDRIVAPQLPTFVASCVSQLLADRLVADIATDPGTAADLLVSICSKLPFGEVIGAHALYQAAVALNGIPDTVITRLYERKPTRQTIPPGTKVATLLKGQRIDIEVVDDRRFVAFLPDGQRHEFSGDPDDSPPVALSDITSWLILSHFAVIPFLAVDRVTQETVGRVDAGILSEVGSCQMVLRRPEGDGPDQIAVHEIGSDMAIVCHKEGIIEPITFSIYTAMTRERDVAYVLIDDAIEQRSLPLLSRINIGLLQIEEQADSEKAEWATRIRNDRVLPQFQDTLLDH